MRWLDGITDSVDISLSKSRSWWWTGRPSVLQSIVSQRVGHDWATELKSIKLTLEFIHLHGNFFNKYFGTFFGDFWQLEKLTDELCIKVCLVKAMVFPVVMYGCGIWTIKKAECQRIDAFELWCWRILLRIPQTARRSNPSILKEISPEYSLEELMLKLKLQYFDHLIQRAYSLEKPLMLGKTENRRRKGRHRLRWLDASPTQWTWVWVSSGRWWRTGKPGVLQSMRLQKVRPDWRTEQQ